METCVKGKHLAQISVSFSHLPSFRIQNGRTGWSK